MNLKATAIARLRHFKKWGDLKGSIHTSGLVRLPDNTVVRRGFKTTNAGTEITWEEPVSWEELKKFQTVVFLEDHITTPPASVVFKVIKNREPVRGRPKFVCYLDDANFRLEA